MQGGRLLTLGDLLQLRDRVTPDMPHEQQLEHVYPLWLEHTPGWICRIR
jgi:hypothetical protein